MIEGNTLLYEAAAPDPMAACVAQAWSDDNSVDEMRIERNVCLGFGYGVVTETAGHNAGAPRAVWTVAGNEFSRVPTDHQVVHRKTSGNESYATVPQ